MAGWALALAIIAIFLGGIQWGRTDACQDDTDDHNRRLYSLENKLRAKGLLDD